MRTQHSSLSTQHSALSTQHSKDRRDTDVANAWTIFITGLSGVFIVMAVLYGAIRITAALVDRRGRSSDGDS